MFYKFIFLLLVDRSELCVAVMCVGPAAVTAPSLDIISSSSSSASSVMRPSWLAGGCGLVLDPVLAMKLVATHDSLRNVPLSSAVCDVTVSRDVSTPVTSSTVTAAVSVTS